MKPMSSTSRLEHSGENKPISQYVDDVVIMKLAHEVQPLSEE